MGFMNSNLSKAVAPDPYETYKTEAKKKLKEMSSSVSLSALSGTGEQAASLLSGSAGYKKPDITAEQEQFLDPKELIKRWMSGELKGKLSKEASAIKADDDAKAKEKKVNIYTSH